MKNNNDDSVLQNYLKVVTSFVDILLELDFSMNMIKVISSSPKFSTFSEKQECSFYRAIENTIYPEDHNLFLSTIEDKQYIKQLLMERRNEFEFRVRNGSEFVWVRGVLTKAQEEDSNKALFYMIDIDKAKRGTILQHEILNKYVYKLCDFLMLINLDNNSYKMIDNSFLHSTPMPPSASNNYISSFNSTIDCYVDFMDQARIREAVTVEKIKENLALDDSYIITYGVRDPKLGYTRKSLNFSYYDKAANIVFAVRTDNTIEYNRQKRQTEELREALFRAQTDVLTGVYNVSIRDVISNRLNGRSKEAALVFLDLDNFKTVNDTFSHAKGDELLIHVGSFLRQQMRSGDLVGRVGGDEFVLFFDTVPSHEEIHERVKRIGHFMANYLRESFSELSVTCSMGIAFYPSDSNTCDGLFQHADTAAYEAKRLGKNRVIMYEENKFSFQILEDMGVSSFAQPYIPYEKKNR